MTTPSLHILFVCLGNICRSPAAESVFNALLAQYNLTDQFIVESAGTGGWHVGERPDGRMIRHGESRGLKFESTGRQFVRADFARFDRIVVMDDANFRDVSRLSASESDTKKIVKMAAFHSSKTVTEVPDPYFGGADGFDLVLDILEDSCAGFLQSMREADFKTTPENSK